MSTKQTSWSEAFAAYLNPRVVAMFFLGLSAGLPYLMVFSTLSAWLRDMGVSRSAIGFFGWVGITYSTKVLWAPIVDGIPLPWLTRWLGQRRSWILVGQMGVMIGLLVMSFSDPVENLRLIALAAVLVAFSSSTQDIAIDAFRIESEVQSLQGAMSATYIFGYRVAMLMAGAGVLYIADFMSWSIAYQAMVLMMLIGVITVFLVPEPPPAPESERAAAVIYEHASGFAKFKHWLKRAVVNPFVDFFQRNGRFAIVILTFIAVYRLSDIVMGIMANPFYLDLGFSKSDIASIGKVFGFFMTILGSFIGGLLVVRYGVHKPLLLGAVMVSATNLLFSQLAVIGADINWLAIVISADNLSAGLSNSAFIAYLSGLTNRAYTATQYALFSSLMTLPGKFISGFSGLVVDATGYELFFIYSALIGIPAICLAWWLQKQEQLKNKET